ncbi:ADP-ribosylation factor-like protein 11 [Eucyclogobius newberryi]|uniref:ADP-ribosylation factor-like protein 11 n=1 Tax=Eucyclogobius newberryi TaxID=166745 RepID=UPI003B5B71C1
MGAGNSSRTPQVLIVGLDSSGKTTLLSYLLTGCPMETSPTIGFNVGTLDLDKKNSLTLWDIGGQKSIRKKWKFYLEDVQALVFVVDSTDKERLPEAAKYLKYILSEDKAEGLPLMVLANKKDKPNSMNIREISNQLNLAVLKDRLWEIQACSGQQGLGLNQAFHSVNKMVKKS